MKKFYSCVDTMIPSPLEEQHLVIKNKAKKAGGGITAYGSEEFRTIKTQLWIKEKLIHTPGIDGVIFFTCYQFMYNDKFNYKLFKDITSKLKLELHFARENLSFVKERFDKNSLNSLKYIIAYSQIISKEKIEKLI